MQGEELLKRLAGNLKPESLWYVKKVYEHCMRSQWSHDLLRVFLWSRVERSPNSGKLSILDYGCGVGAMIPRIAQWLPKLAIYGVGYDPDPDMVMAAQLNDPDHVYVSELYELSKLGGQFDIVVMSHCIAHCDDALFALKYAHAMLKDGGTVLVLTTNKWHDLLRTVHNKITGYKSDPTIVRDYSGSQLKELLNRSGFTVTKTTTWGERVPFLGWLGNWTGLTLAGAGIK